MGIFLYIIIFLIGTFFGSFFTLAVYRIPRKEDILIKHSYCPNCNSRLGFFDLFPILSYLLLGGKCRYCKSKIRPRYLILEILSGITFVILAYSTKINLLDFNSIINTSSLLLYVAILFIIAGIDKENIKIEKNVVFFGYFIEVLYIIYQYTLGNGNVYQYVIYLILFIVLIFLSNKSIKNNEIEKYKIQNLYLALYVLIYSGWTICALTLVLGFIIMLIYKKILGQTRREQPIGFYLSISNIVIIAISNIVINYII